ncbi:hypothetical protein ACE1BS_07495 [Aeromonas jandaei]
MAFACAFFSHSWDALNVVGNVVKNCDDGAGMVPSGFALLRM